LVSADVGSCRVPTPGFIEITGNGRCVVSVDLTHMISLEPDYEKGEIVTKTLTFHGVAE